jgi:hypothetical protein
MKLLVIDAASVLNEVQRMPQKSVCLYYGARISRYIDMS